jgi:hypothetical protein
VELLELELPLRAVRQWLGARKASRQLMGSGTSVQRFLYKEFVHAWKQAGR